jgi:phenylpyruvate tautomerase PptA (4-oxalocrotonate tautomerase family)
MAPSGAADDHRGPVEQWPPASSSRDENEEQSIPLVRIELLREGGTEGRARAVGDAVHRTMVEHLGVPERDRFQIIGEHAPGRLVYDPRYLGVERTHGFVFVQVFLSAGRTTDQKRAFYARLAELLEGDPVGMRPEDVAVALVENAREDWSFGNGKAQYLILPKDQWR